MTLPLEGVNVLYRNKESLAPNMKFARGKDAKMETRARSRLTLEGLTFAALADRIDSICEFESAQARRNVRI